MAKFHIPIDPNPARFAQIGELAARWGWIENQASVLIRELLRLTKPEVLMVLGKVGIYHKCQAIRALSKHAAARNKLGKTAKELERVAKAIQDADEFRNDVLHGLWVHFPQDTDNLALLRRASIEQKVDPKPDIDVVKSLPDQIAALRTIQFDAQRVTDALKALRGKF